MFVHSQSVTEKCPLVGVFCFFQYFEKLEKKKCPPHSSSIQKANVEPVIKEMGRHLNPILVGPHRPTTGHRFGETAEWNPKASILNVTTGLETRQNGILGLPTNSGLISSLIMINMSGGFNMKSWRHPSWVYTGLWCATLSVFSCQLSIFDFRQ